ncbi:50S ribosomal protein L17 [Candidatus Fermentibacteria bacterium]|nr:50S ribosomal protein L17 [Candidatus Fermentibacteria bacterium]
MRHRKNTPKLGLRRDDRVRMLRNLVTSIILKERVTTSPAKARAARSMVEKIITRGKTDTLHARRIVAASVYGAEAVRKVFNDLGPRYAARPGGYTRILKLGPRVGDAAEACMLELVDSPVAFKPEEKEKKAKKDRKAEREEREKKQSSAGRGRKAGKF